MPSQANYDRFFGSDPTQVTLERPLVLLVGFAPLVVPIGSVVYAADKPVYPTGGYYYVRVVSTPDGKYPQGEYGSAHIDKLIELGLKPVSVMPTV